MKIHVLSDLHTEFAPFHPPETDADVVVLAGDTATGLDGMQLARDWFPERPVLYVAGNHEFYRKSTPRLQRRLAEAGRAWGIHYLENTEVVIGGVRFLGCTLWTDFELFGERQVSMAAAQAVMNDFRLIRVDPEYRRFRPADARVSHLISLDWLVRTLETPFDGPTVVVTHHAPSLRSVNPPYRDHPATPAYASDLEWLLDGRAAMWIHGHTHVCLDYELGGTRVVSNQRGYAEEDPVDGFDPAYVVELG
ncbi:metallophosphoesterase [Longimicrobium sp.]|uniref:metallophosphoesterase n=1 Tax=Longimicrobium sp. TaxID=2029185 RepID=UPI002E2F120D|nr:metallophosphoesterase [Longimicrobium sp.]HEX6037834.1 metallophosphoesterase [Longimicrobium sp.]